MNLKNMQKNGLKTFDEIICSSDSCEFSYINDKLNL